MANNMNFLAALALIGEVTTDAIRIKALPPGDARLAEEAKDLIQIMTEAEAIWLPGDTQGAELLAVVKLAFGFLAHGPDTDAAVAHQVGQSIGALLMFLAKRNPKHASVYTHIATDVAADVVNNWPTPMTATALGQGGAE